MAGRLYLDHDSIGQEPDRYIVIKRRPPKDALPVDVATITLEEPVKKKDKYLSDRYPILHHFIFDNIPQGMSEILPGYVSN